MKNNMIAFAFCASACLALPAMAQTPAAAVNPEMTKVLAENAKTTVSDNVLKPGESGPMAVRNGGAFYYVTGGTFELTYQDGTKKTVTRKTGTATLSTEAKAYSPKNIGKTTIHVIAVIPK